MRLFPIPGGLYAENPREFWLFVDGIIAGLAPRDALEVEQAKQVALAYMRLDRLDRLESDLADADGTLTPSDAMLVTDLGAYVDGPIRETNPTAANDRIGTRAPHHSMLHGRT